MDGMGGLDIYLDGSLYAWRYKAIAIFARLNKLQSFVFCRVIYSLYNVTL